MINQIPRILLDHPFQTVGQARVPLTVMFTPDWLPMCVLSDSPELENYIVNANVFLEDRSSVSGKCLYFMRGFFFKPACIYSFYLFLFIFYFILISMYVFIFVSYPSSSVRQPNEYARTAQHL